MIDLQEVKDRLDRLCKLVEENGRAGATACSVAYALDVPRLIEEVEHLRIQNQRLQADNEVQGQAMEALGKRMEE